jgi:hypothetical protein
VQGKKSSQDQMVIFVAKEKYEPHYDQRIEDKAINIVSSWYEHPNKLKELNRDQKVQLIWKMQVE